MVTNLYRISVATSASIANLGAGYDCLALSVNLMNRYDMYIDLRGNDTRDGQCEIRLEGKYREFDQQRMTNSSGNLFLKSFYRTLSYFRDKSRIDAPAKPIFVYQIVDIPLKRGLGSSSSASVAGVLAAARYFQVFSGKEKIDGKTMDELVEDGNFCCSVAMLSDNCPDNICASHSGGLTSSMLVKREHTVDKLIDEVFFYRDSIEDPNFRVVALIPNKYIATDQAKGALGQRLSVQSAAANVCRSTLIPFIIRQKDYFMLKEAMRDEIHQNERVKRFYVDDEGKHTMDLGHIIERTTRAGAYGVCIGGAGSTLVAFADRGDVENVKNEFIDSFRFTAPTGWEIEDVLVLKPRNERFEMELGYQDESPESLPPPVGTWYHASTSITRRPPQKATVLWAPQG